MQRRCFFEIKITERKDISKFLSKTFK